MLEIQLAEEESLCFKIINIQKYTDIIVLILDGTDFNLDKPVLLVCAYIAPEGSVLYETLDESDGIMRLENIMVDIVSKYGDLRVILMGDLNARIGKMCDFIENDNFRE